MNNIQFKIQTLFTCSVPEGILLIKDFNEMIATDEPLDRTALLQTITMSFENIGLKIQEINLSKDNLFCDVTLSNDKHVENIRVIIRSRPSLVVNGNIFKLEDFDI